MTNDFSFEACMQSVTMSVESFHADPIREYGESILRAEQDPFFNKTMIEAWREYIHQNHIKWNDKPAKRTENKTDLDDIRANLDDIQERLADIMAELNRR